MARSSALPDSNFKPSLVLYDSGTGRTFALEGEEETGAAFVNIVDGSGNVIGSTSNALDVNIKSGTVTIDPTGLATSAKQDTGNTSLASIDGKLPALGQALAASSVPVVLTSAQLSTLTPLSTVAVTGTFWQATQPISAVSLPLPALAATSTKQSDGTQKTQVVDGGGNVIGATSNALDINIKSGNPTTIAVTNAGTFAVQATPVTQLDTFMLGGVNIKEINGVIPLMGSGIMGTGALRVTIASDNDALTVKQATGTNLHTVLDSGTVTTVSTVTNLSQIATVVPTFAAVTNAATIAGVLDVIPVGQYNSAPGSITDGRYNHFQLDAKGNQRIVLMDAAGNARGVNIDSSNRLSVTLDNIAAAQTLATVTTVSTVTNLSQMNGAALLMGNGATGTGSQRVTVASDNSAIALWGHGATGSAVPANGIYMGISDAGTLRGLLQAANALNSTGTGIPTSQIVGQFDDSSPTSITENQFGNLRMSANRNLYNTIRDAAGNERGLNVDVNGEIGIGAIRTSVTPGTSAGHLGKAEDGAHITGDTGVMALGVRNDAVAAISGTDLDYTPIGTDSNGTVHVVQKGTTGTLTNVNTSTTSATLLAANNARIGAQITNEATTVLYIKFGTTASATSYTVTLAGASAAPYSYYEVPAGYTGRIDGILASSTGTARVTEITP